MIDLLSREGIEIDPHARGAYRGVHYDGIVLRLYVITWLCSATEWTLLAVLGAQPGTQAHRGMRLTIHDQT